MKENTFGKNVATLMLGTGAAQVITFILAPIVTRIFSPEDFTTLEHYAMLLSLLSVFSTFKMELAIVQAGSDQKAKALTIWIIKLCFWVSLGLFVLIFFKGDLISNYFQNPLLKPFLYLIPINLFLFGLFQIMVYWHHRNKDFQKTSISKILFNSSNEGVKIGMGSLGFKPDGLIWANVLARLVSVLYLAKKASRNWLSLQTHKVLQREVVREHSDFYKFSVWGSFLGKLSTWAHVILFSHFFGLWSIGFFALSRRLVLSPLSIFSQSFAQVFYQQISSMTDLKAVRTLFFKFFFRLLVIALVLIITVLLIPNQFYAWALGEKWKLLGDFMKILIFWFALNFVTSCLAFISYRLKKQKQMFVLDLLHFLIVVGAICYGFYTGSSEWETLEYFVIGKILFFVINICAMVYFVLSSKTFNRS